MLIKGFKFGMLLQIAVGPVCLFIFGTSVENGFWQAMQGVAAVTLVDSLFIIGAILGMAAILEKKEGAKTFFKYFGASILILFGLQTLLGVFGLSILPAINLFRSVSSGSAFPKVLLLTLSNPLTIMFWAGVFSSKIVEDGLGRKEMYLFGAGAVLSTLLFMTFVSALGSVAGIFIPEAAMSVLNGLVGLILIGFGLRTVYRK
ncbi:LysE family transporter [Gudongella oleilytica]|jgi:threonine/homoserine/homoserine lactone efflux protein|uniref:LysE family translocator n=1 Tax=Gudongella oleilytica TaxID=1582259 RepID=UPI002A3673B6|nr:LysE family transporter [Gudongella oleilytica]MDY0256524.1 LysE family transporter [Gudongella oleilytica]